MKRVAWALLAALPGTGGAQLVYTYSGPDVPIPDIGTLDVPLNVPDAFVLDRLELGIRIAHTWQGDLKVSLIGPWSGAIVLTDRPGSPQQAFGFSADNYGSASAPTFMVFTDLGATTYDSPQVPVPGIPNVVGNWRAEGGSLDTWGGGRQAMGTWTLRVEDFAAGDIGVVRSFQIRTWPVPEPAAGVALVVGLGWLVRRRRMPGDSGQSAIRNLV